MTVPTCPDCRRPYNGPTGCNKYALPHAHFYGHEPHRRWWRRLPARCIDCGTPRGHRHHGGCLHAYCTRCNGQAVMCDPDRCDDGSDE